MPKEQLYLFETAETAEKYLHMHSTRLAGFDIPKVKGKIFEVNSLLTEINH
ncbi:YdhR family protein [Planococcus sp. ISL-110]|uniref:YdhR family protein n=1 Tax=Planococcus sp. ISL-110 TaxID=2819167 RepID=UPI001BE8B064|nr:YdhR family protein [Planococcus sp. ISL-110]